jgi:hypothetical protein
MTFTILFRPFWSPLILQSRSALEQIAPGPTAVVFEQGHCRTESGVELTHFNPKLGPTARQKSECPVSRQLVYGDSILLL